MTQRTLSNTLDTDTVQQVNTDTQRDNQPSVSTTADRDRAQQSRTEAPTDTDDRFFLVYQNSIENVGVIRRYTHHGTYIREVNEEWMYNYVAEAWEQTYQYVRDYDVAPDGVTLTGDGSNWRGTGREWRSWFTQRHRELLGKRFPYDELETINESVFVDASTLNDELLDALPEAFEVASDE